MTQRVSILNSDDTLLVNDYDFNFVNRRQIDDIGGVLYSDLSTKPEFDLTLATGDVTSGEAIIIVERTASQPISNEKFLVRFVSSATETLDVTIGNKIYIEINDTLLQDPTQIVDTPPSTNYANGLGIGEIKSTASYPSHSNYIKLWEITSGPTAVDVRVLPQIDGNKVDLTALTGDVTTTGNITGGDITGNDFSGDNFITPTGNLQTQIDNLVTASLYYGDGSDGDVVISSGTTTLTEDMFYNNLTVSTGAILDTNGYKVFILGELDGGGTITTTPNNGTNAALNIKGTGGAIANLGTLGTASAGGDGANGGSGGPSSGSATQSITVVSTYNTYTSKCNGGNGGSTKYFSGGVPGNGNATEGKLIDLALSEFTKLDMYNISSPVEYIGLTGGTGGASGANDSAGQSGGGGGGGAGGAIIFIAVTTFSFAGIIQVDGGNGGNGGNASASSNYDFVGGGGGGGGGGAGGIIYIVSNTFTNTGSIIVNGGNGGNGGNADLATGTSRAKGGDGGDGGQGGVFVLHYSTKVNGTIDITGGTAGVGGTSVGTTAPADGVAGGDGLVVYIQE